MNRKMIRILKQGGVGVLATDTLYGLVGSAFSKKTVARIFKLKKRNPRKPLIVLIDSPARLSLFGITLSSADVRILRSVWPGKVSVVLPCPRARFAYLHRGTRSLAFRVPKDMRLKRLLKRTGPLVAPSANPEGKPPARTVNEARRYFGDAVDVYVGRGRRSSVPSTLVSLERGILKVLRKGAVKL